MKILHAVESLNRGGLERAVIDLARLQSRNGHDVCVLCLMEKGLLVPDLAAVGIQVISMDKKTLGAYAALKNLRLTLKRFRPDVIHTHNPIPNYFVVLATLDMSGLNIINTRHGMGQYWKSNKGKLLYFFSQFKTRYVAAVCDSAKDLFIETKQVMASKAITIKNGINTDKITKRNLASKTILCDSLDIPACCKLIGTVGRLNYVKNHSLLLNSFAKIQLQEKDLHLVIIGDGELRPQLEVQATQLGLCNAVHFLGDRNDVYSLLPALDIFVLTSISEGFSIALLEACASGLPIIATDVGGNKEIVQNEKTGLLIPSDNPDALVLAMLSLIHDKTLCYKLGDNAYHWLLKEASLEVMSDRYMKVYQAR